ncbi:hypothetical protein D9619_011177 [Psilocybe cf. subviscida]|uniref:Uncharacterized protein n=1 Tax=Psilocybe cf. subviscida TaxID=2480587 RepID=A0A8H5BIU4_9AGAR|nr:hypothetical protein D9619_011177 [Psilocybe cf. subviscida]
MDLFAAPLNVYMDLFIEPRDLEQCSALFDRQDAWNHKGVDAIVLINAIFDASARSSPREFSEAALNVVRTALPDSRIFVLNIRHNYNLISTHILGPRPELIEIARESNFGFERIAFPLHSIDGPTIPLQRLYNPRYIDGPGTPGMNGDVCNMINHINQQIRFNKNNDFKLRTLMITRDTWRS